MTAFPRRFAVASLAALMPLAAVSIATAAPSAAQSCSRGQVSFNGNCVDTCNDSQVRNSNTGECQSLLSAALQKADAPAVAKLTPDQLGGVVQLARNVGALPEINATIGTSFGIANTVIGWPAVAAAAAADTAATLAFLGLVPGEIGGASLATAAATTGQTFAAASDIARVTSSLPAASLPALGLPQLPAAGLPQLPPPVGLPELPPVGLPQLPPVGLPQLPPVGLPQLPPPVGLPELPSVGLPELPPVGLPQLPPVGLPELPPVGPPPLPTIGLPRFGNTNICGPRLLFFTPCL